MNILRIARKIPPSLGGQEHHVVDLSYYQSKYGDKVYIYFGMGDHPKKNPNIISKKIIPNFLYSIIRIDVIQAFLFGLILFLYHLKKNHKKIDIVHIHGDILEIFFAWLVTKRYNAKLIVTFHAGLSNKLWYKKVAPHVFKLPDSMICVSFHIAQQVRHIYPEATCLHNIHSGIFRDKFLRLNNYSFSLPLKVISVGRLHVMKGFDNIILALANKHIKNLVHLTIVGDGPEKKSLQRLADELNLKIDLIGRKTKKEVVKYLHQSHLFVSSSIELKEQTEGTPTVIMEAMAAGLPVIATNVGGAKYILKDKENGFVVKPKNNIAIVTAIKNFIDNEQLLYKQSKQNVYDSIEFDWEKIGLKITNIYKLALKI